MGVFLSPKHGVNPSILVCSVCAKDTAVALFGKLKGEDREAPHRTFDTQPCEECRAHMELGIILVSVDESKSDDPKNPYRTGGYVVVKPDLIERVVFDGETKKQILERRVAFITDEVWDVIGLPRG